MTVAYGIQFIASFFVKIYEKIMKTSLLTTPKTQKLENNDKKIKKC